MIRFRIHKIIVTFQLKRDITNTPVVLLNVIENIDFLEFKRYGTNVVITSDPPSTDDTL